MEQLECKEEGKRTGCTHSRTPVEFESCPDEVIMAGSAKAEGMGTDKGRSINGKGR